MRRKLALVGGGPKAAAIAAKAKALSAVGHETPEIILFEKDELAAAWTGRNGYTDGLQPLCTVAERDLGFPYGGTFGPAVAEFMMKEFSWSTYVVREYPSTDQYRDWVLDDRQPPPHAVFADYVTRAILRSDAQHLAKEVTAINYNARTDRWEVNYRGDGGSCLEVDGVVITGTGPPLPALPGANARVFDARSFWQNTLDVLQLVEDDQDPGVIIIGAGGGGAAIAHWVGHNLKSRTPIKIIGRGPTLYSRRTGYFEDRLFSDEEAWERLSANSRQSFLDRLNSGVVWEYVLQTLRPENVEYECGNVLGFAPFSATNHGVSPPELYAEVAPVAPQGVASSPTTVVAMPASVFIDARGFDSWWFVDKLLDPLMRPHFHAANRTVLQGAATQSLCVGGPYPRLHIPQLAALQGPAAPNLMALGWMADRILSEYVPLGTTPLSSTLARLT